MALFSRRRRNNDEPTPESGTEATQDAVAEDGAASDTGKTTAPQGEPDGPYDVADRPDLDGRLDLGALRVRLLVGAQVGFSTNPERTAVHGVTLRTNDSAIVIELFAAPRTFGIWDDIREEMKEALTAQNASSDELDGPFGRELVARQVVKRPDGSTERVPARIIGIDGPRWFLRAAASGALAMLVGAERDRHPLEKILADVVVVRDGQARAPRSRIEMDLPQGVTLNAPGQPGAPAPAKVQAPQRQDVPDADEVLRRGPEITETR